MRLKKKNEAYGTEKDDTVNKLKIDFGYNYLLLPVYGAI